MRYYDEYVHINAKGSIGIIEINSQDYQDARFKAKDVDEVVYINDHRNINRAFHGDTVRVNDQGSVEQIITSDRKQHKYVGYVRLDEKQKHGVNKKGYPIYMFHPLSRRHPCMLVATSAAKKFPHASAVYIIVEYLEWNCDQRYPRGICVDIIGPSGDITSDAMARAHYHTVFDNNHKLSNTYEVPTMHSTRITINSDRTPVFSIDPDGCVDIDDAIHVSRLSCDEVEVGVHIADVTSFFEAHSDIDIEAQHRAFTVYLPEGNQIPIIHEDLAHNQCSLLPNMERFTLSCMLSYRKVDGKYKRYGYKFIPTVIRSIAALTYDDVDARNVIDSLLQSIRLLEDLTGTKNDSHKLVEILMIEANKAAAEYLLESRSALLRRQQPMCPAEYIIATDTTTELGHYELGIDRYTHFTSPIRRYADQLVHRMIMHRLISSVPDSVISHLNSKQKYNKRFHRDADLLKIVHSCISPSELHNIEGVVLPFRKSETQPDSYKVDIFLPTLKSNYPLRFNNKTAHLLHMELVSTNHLIIENVHTRVKLHVQEGQSITVSLYSSPHEPLLHNKCKLGWTQLQNLLAS